MNLSHRVLRTAFPRLGFGKFPPRQTEREAPARPQPQIGEGNEEHLPLHFRIVVIDHLHRVPSAAEATSHVVRISLRIVRLVRMERDGVAELGQKFLVAIEVENLAICEQEAQQTRI